MSEAVAIEPTSATRPGTVGRIESLDQYRGYTVVGMLVVNFLGSYAAVPAVLKHHNTYCSYADTIMPQFFFAVGFAYRLTFLRRQQRAGSRSAYRHALLRNLGLILLGLVFYGLDGRVQNFAELRELGLVGFLTTAFQKVPFQALTHIGLTALWILPVIGAAPGVRVGYGLTSALLHLGLSAWFYFDWAWNRPVIDGGPLGFLTWALPMLAGTLAYDAMAALGPKRVAGPMLGVGVLLMAVGYALSCLGSAGIAPPPLVAPAPDRVVDLWTMSQRTGSLSYQTFSAGACLAVLVAFIVACDLLRLRAGLFRTFGVNALAAYIIHGMVGEFVGPYAPDDSPLVYVFAIVLLYMAINWLFVRHLERQGLFLRL